MTEATLNRVGNDPSANDSAARRAINGANKSTDDFSTDVGILSITDDLAGILRISLLTSSIDGERKSVSNLPVWSTSNCIGLVSHSLLVRLDFIVCLMLLILLMKKPENPTQRRWLSMGDKTSGDSV